MKKYKKYIFSILIIFVSLFFLQRLLVPKYLGKMQEGRLIGEYYGDDFGHDLIFIGDCEVYENFSPKVLWEESGINSYIRGSAQQLIWQSYYLLEDTLRYERPEAVVFNVLAMQYDTPQREEYNRMTLEGMRWSPAKVKAIRASMTKEEHFIDYIFPILRYHSRWNEISWEDISHMFDKAKVSHNGYYMRTDVKPAATVPDGRVLPDYSFGKDAYKYLDMMTALCKENDIRLILVKAPSLYPYWYPQWDNQIEKYARENDLLYINYLDLVEETGLDFTKDTYDGGLHLNVYGAEKISLHLGNYLIENGILEDKRDDEKLARLWQDKIAAYEKEKLSKEKSGGRID